MGIRRGIIIVVVWGCCRKIRGIMFMIDVVSVHSFCRPARLCNCFFDNAVEGGFPIASVGKVHKTHLTDKSRNSRDHVWMMSFLRYDARQEDFVG